MRRLLAAVGLLAVLFVTRPAHACWDGWSATAGPIEIMQAGDETWSAVTARAFARWSARLEMVIPPGSVLRVVHGFVSIEGTGIEDLRWVGSDLENLFDLVVRAQHVTNVSGAMARDRTALTVQVFAAHDEKAAEALAEKIDERNRNETGPGLPGSFYDAGGYPAYHRIAHVLETKDAAGKPLYQVVVGAFLLRTDAEVARDVLAKSFGQRGFVRAL